VGGYDLTGSHVQSSSNVLVVAGYGKAAVYGIYLDHHTEVILPTNQLGTEYYMMSSPTRTAPDVLRITGAICYGEIIYFNVFV